MDNKRAFDPFGRSFPAVDINGGGSICVPVPVRLIPYLLGAINPLRWPDVWNGDPAAINQTTAQVENFLATLITHEACPGAPECPECPPGKPCPTCGPSGGGLGLMECDLMPCLDISNLLKIVDGVLYVLDSCCTWVAVGDIANVPPALGDAPLDPHSTGTVTYSACGKAAAIVGAIYNVLNATWESFGDWDYPWQILPNIEKTVGYNLNNKWLATLIVDWLAYGAVVSPSDVFGDYDRQFSICNLVNFFEDDAVGVPDEDAYSAVKAALHTANFLYDGLIMTAVACLGRANLDTIAKLGAGDLGLDCGCPERDFDEVVDVSGLDWYYLIDVRTTPFPAGADFSGQHNCPTQSDAYVAGMGLGACPSQYGRCQVTVELPVLNKATLTDSQLTRAGIQWTTHPGDNYKTTSGYQVIGFDNGSAVIQVGSVDSYPASGGGWFSFVQSLVPNAINSADHFTIRMDWENLADGFEEDNPLTGNFVKWFFVGGTGQKPDLGYE